MLAGQDGEMAVIGFDHRIQVMQDFTNEATKLSEAMKKMTPGSAEHAVIDAEDSAIRMLKNRPLDRRRVLLLIAEKRDKGSELRLREALTQAQFANVADLFAGHFDGCRCPDRQGHAAASAGHPAEAQHMPGDWPSTPTTIEQNYYNGNYIPVFVDIFKAVRVFLLTTLWMYSRALPAAGNTRSSARKAWRKRSQGISEELHSQYLLSYSPNNRPKADSTTSRWW